MLINKLAAALNVNAIQDRVLLYNLSVKNGTNIPSFLLDDLIAQQVEYLVAIHVALAREVGGWPWPEMLHNLGWAGHLIYAVFCTRSGMWTAINELVRRSHPEAPFLTALGEEDEKVDSIPERFVCRRIRLLPGIVGAKIHPELPGGLPTMMKADLLVTAATGRTAYVELTMVPVEPHADNQVYVKYRKGFARKMHVYKSLGIEPFVIWADQAASPRALAEALNALLARLDLPTRPPTPPAWFESEVV